jgi:ankyrin repeat protein
MKASLVVVLMLAGCGAHPGSRLSRAVDGGNISEVHGLLASGASGGEIEDALVWAARIGNTAAIPLLVNAGANVDGTSGVNGWTVLMHAVHKGQDGSVKAYSGRARIRIAAEVRAVLL